MCAEAGDFPHGELPQVISPRDFPPVILTGDLPQVKSSVMRVL